MASTTTNEFLFSQDEFNALPSADQLPNVKEFISRAYLGEGTNIPNNFKVMPGIKNSAQIAFVQIQSVLQDVSCDWETASTQALQTITISVNSACAMLEICQYTLEQTFIANEMAKGANANYTSGNFFTYFWMEVSKKINEEMTIIRWQGDRAGTGPEYSGVNEFKKRSDGFIKKLNNAITGVEAVTNGAGTQAQLSVKVSKDGGVESVQVIDGGTYSTTPTTVTLSNVGEGVDATFTIQTTGTTPNIEIASVTVTNPGYGYPSKVLHVTSSAISESTILAEMKKAFLKIPAEIRADKKKLRWFMSSTESDLYALKVSENNNINYITTGLPMTYLGIPIVVEDGLPDGYMVICRGQESLLYAFDGMGDEQKMNIVDLSKTIAVRKLRARVDVKMSYYTLHNDQIVYYAPDPA